MGTLPHRLAVPAIVWKILPMKTFALALTLMLGLLLAVPTFAADKPKAAKKLQHVVCFKFKEAATKAQIEKLNKEFAALKEKIPGITGYEAGVNNSPEGLNKGFTHCYIITFKTEKDREAYLPHPEHQKFVTIVKEIVDDVFVIDFWTE
jgi:hypothetical protein